MDIVWSKVRRDAKASIKSVFHFTAMEGVVGNPDSDFIQNPAPSHLRQIAICILVLKNSDTVVGIHHATKKNPNKDTQQKKAYQAALDKVIGEAEDRAYDDFNLLMHEIALGVGDRD